MKRNKLIFIPVLIAALSYTCHLLEKEVTFSEHIAPIVHKNCMPCHRPGEAGPFSLMTYQDVAKRAKMVAFVTKTRFMPPWPADPLYRHFANEMSLSDAEIELIQKWARQGAPPGDTSKLPELPDYPTGSQLGEPDLVLKMNEPFFIKGDNEDKFLIIKIPYELPNDTFVRAIEFVPDNRQLLHHMNGHLISYKFDEKEDVFGGKYVIDSSYYMERDSMWRLLDLYNNDGSYPAIKPVVCSYLPGVYTNIYPKGIGGFVMKRKGVLLINDMHYGPTPIDTTDQSYFNIFFDDKPPERPTFELQMGTLGISEIVPPLVIPPNEIKTFRTKAKILNDISLLTINPHMHLLGKSFLAYAVKPDGDTIPLIRIKEWDFRWQFYYTFKKMLHLPKNTMIYVEATYDNTTDNPYNPFNPPRTIAERDGSMKTTDEMLQFIMTFVPYRPGDENISLEDVELQD